MRVLLSVVIFCPNSEQFFYFGICCLPYCCVIVIFYCTAIWATVRELLGRAGMLSVKQCVSQFMSQSRYTLGSCTIRIDADIFAVQQDGIVTQKVVAKTDVF